MFYLLPDPFNDVMIGVVQLRLEYFQVSNFESRWSKGNFKVHWDWRPGPLLLSVCCKKLYLCRDLRFLHSSHSLDLPYNSILACLVLGFSFHTDELYPTGVQWSWNSHFNLLGQQWGFEVRLDNNLDLQLGSSNLSDQRNDAEWERNILIITISYFECTTR